MNSYELSRIWFDWCFDNASKIRPVHTALFFFIMEHNNRLGWKKEFGLPRDMAMDAIGVKNNRTFSGAFSDLEEWGFIKVVERSKNQYSANIISLSGCVKNTPATTKALDIAMQKHLHKQSIGIAPIDKHINIETNTISVSEIEVDLSGGEGGFKDRILKDLKETKYSESDFLDNWTTCRKHFLKTETHIKNLNFHERTEFERVKKTYSKEEINAAMQTLFKQERIPVEAMVLRPKHFLEKFDTYYSAGKSTKIYATKQKQTEY